MTDVRTSILLQDELLEASKRSDGFASMGQGPPLFCSCYQPQSYVSLQIYMSYNVLVNPSKRLYNLVCKYIKFHNF